MRITDLKVDGFGVWSGLELDDLSGELNVFYGPNEAGKTTLMQFVRSMLFGFAPQRRARYLPPVAGGPAGGTLRCQLGSQAFTIQRHCASPDENPPPLVTAPGRPAVADDAALAPFLGPVDEPLFNGVFAFGLREIQELNTLSDTQAADELYSLALGSQGVSLVEVLRELEGSRSRLLSVDDRPSLVTQLVAERQRLRDQVADLSQATDRYLALSAERASLDAEMSSLEQEHGRLEAELRELALARGLAARWQRRAAIDGELAGLGPVVELPPDLLGRFERTTARIAARRARYARLRQQAAALRTEIDSLGVNEALYRQAPRVEALVEQQHWLRSLADDVRRLEVELLELEARREQRQQQWGAAGTSLERGALGELRRVARASAAARRELQTLNGQAAAAEKASGALRQEIDAALGEAAPRGLNEMLQVAGTMVSQLRRRVQLDERIDQLSRRQTDLDEETREHLENQLLPTWMLAALGGAFVLGCALVLLFVAGLVLPASLSDALGWPVGLVGVLAAGGAAVAKIGLEQRAASRLDSCRGQAGTLKQQLAEASAERDELDQQLPRGGGPLVSRLQSAERALARCEELLPLDARRATAQREAEELAARAASARDAHRGLRKRWRRLLSEHQLPLDVRPSALAAFRRGHRQAHGLGRQIAERQSTLSSRRAEYDAVAARIRQLVNESALAPRGNSPLELLAQLQAELAEQQKLVLKRVALDGQLRRVRRRHRRLRRQAALLSRRRQALLTLAGAFDEAELRRRAAGCQQRANLQAERASIEQEITATLGERGEAQLATWLAPDKNLAQLEEQLALGRQSAFERLSQAAGRRGEVIEQLRVLAEDRQLPQLRLELGIVEQRLHDALQRWRVLAVCELLLNSVRDQYEREHQPQALREASLYLARLTGGRYRRVWTPLGQHALRIDDEQGNSLGVELLSRGTREQLFLALRLALVRTYARRGVTLPLVLDDIFVNFDTTRARSAAAVLRDFARDGHQILVFTCHEHIARLFRNLKADVRQLPDRWQSPRADAAPRRVRRALPSEAAPEMQSDVQEVIAAQEEPVAARPAIEPAPMVVFVEQPRPVPAVAAPLVRVELSPPVAPAPARPSPPRRDVRPIAPRMRMGARRHEWSAEEFDGELTDRVRRLESAENWDREVHSDLDEAFAAGDDGP